MKRTPSRPSPAPAPYLLPDGPIMRIGNIVRAENLPMDSGEPKNSDSVDPLANKVISRYRSLRKPAASASRRPPTGGMQASGPHYPHGSLQDPPNQALAGASSDDQNSALTHIQVVPQVGPSEEGLPSRPLLPLPIHDPTGTELQAIPPSEAHPSGYIPPPSSSSHQDPTSSHAQGIARSEEGPYESLFPTSNQDLATSHARADNVPQVGHWNQNSANNEEQVIPQVSNHAGGQLSACQSADPPVGSNDDLMGDDQPTTSANLPVGSNNDSMDDDQTTTSFPGSFPMDQNQNQRPIVDPQTSFPPSSSFKDDDFVMNVPSASGASTSTASIPSQSQPATGPVPSSTSTALSIPSGGMPSQHENGPVPSSTSMELSIPSREIPSQHATGPLPSNTSTTLPEMPSQHTTAPNAVDLVEISQLKEAIQASVNDALITLLPQLLLRLPPGTLPTSNTTGPRLVDVNMHDDELSRPPPTKAGKGERKTGTKINRLSSIKGKEKEKVGHGSDADDMDASDYADDEDDADNAGIVKSMISKPEKKKVRTSRSKEENAYHNLIRDYLRGKGVYVDNPDDLRSPPHQAVIDGFVENNTGGPTLEEPRFNWEEHLDSAWNHQLIFMMAKDLQPMLRAAPILKAWETRFTEIRYLRQKITMKLGKSRNQYMSRQPPPIDSTETATQKVDRISQKKLMGQKRNRRTTRRRGTYDRRCKIIEDRESENPPFWQAVRKLLEDLGDLGMSSDETDSERRTVKHLKVVRRVPKIWLSPTISALWNAVEDYGRGLYDRQGNTPLQRLYEPNPSAPLTPAKRKARLAVKCVSGLPMNYYSTVWWKTLSSSQQALVLRLPTKELPDYGILLR